MQFNTRIMFAVLTLATGLAGATQAQAGQGSVMLGASNFADRCDERGGDLAGFGTDLGCDLGSTFVECSFSGAYADCVWTGGQNQGAVTRLLGMVNLDSLSSDSDTLHKKKKGGIQIPDLPLKL